MIKSITGIISLLLLVTPFISYALPSLTEPNAAAVCDDGSMPTCAQDGQTAACADGSTAFCRIWRWKTYVTSNSLCVNGNALCNRAATAEVSTAITK